jgi:hypothetical protein
MCSCREGSDKINFLCTGCLVKGQPQGTKAQKKHYNFTFVKKRGINRFEGNSYDHTGFCCDPHRFL